MGSCISKRCLSSPKRRSAGGSPTTNDADGSRKLAAQDRETTKNSSVNSGARPNVEQAAAADASPDCGGDVSDDDEHGRIQRSSSGMNRERMIALLQRVKRQSQEGEIATFQSKINGKAGKEQRPPCKQRKKDRVYSQPIVVSQNFVVPNYPKSSKDVEFIDASLGDNFIFASLAPKERASLIGAMKRHAVSADTVIIKQGDIGDFFYVVDRGRVAYVVDGVAQPGECTRGGSFGELSLLYDCTRNATCVARTDCILWRVDQRTFRHMLAFIAAERSEEVVDVLRRVPFLEELDDLHLKKIEDALTAVSYREGERIINKGDIGEVFYIVQVGRARVHDIGFGDSMYVDQVLGPSDWFGEHALITGEPRSANVTAVSAGGVDCLCLSRETFEDILGPLEELIDRAARKRVLMGVPVFANSNLQPREMTKLTDSLTEVSFAEGEVIVEAGKVTPRKCLYLIQKGKITAYSPDTGQTNHLQPGDYFGDKYLRSAAECAEGKDNSDSGGSFAVSSASASSDDVADKTFTATEETKCLVLTSFAVETVIGSLTRLGKSISLKRQLDASVKLDDLNKVQIVGMGAFAKVWLVNHRSKVPPDGVYAIRILDKRNILRNAGNHPSCNGSMRLRDQQQCQADIILREKIIMTVVRHPFVIELVATFQDTMNLYFLVNFVQGGELFSVIHTDAQTGVLDSDARFYAACILEALIHVHDWNICYRDLKPENVLIGADGYCVLIDFGNATIIKEGDKTYTLCGTPEYLAPEMILSKGHSKNVDYWAFGVLIYEMLVGESPFYSPDRVSLFKQIVEVDYTFPGEGEGPVVHEKAQDLIGRLIVKRECSRLGCLRDGYSDVRNHEWFDPIDADMLLCKNITAPWIPRVRGPLDASHFECYGHAEDEPPSNTPALTQCQQDYFRDF